MTESITICWVNAKLLTRWGAILLPGQRVTSHQGTIITTVICLLNPNVQVILSVPIDLAGHPGLSTVLAGISAAPMTMAVLGYQVRPVLSVAPPLHFLPLDLVLPLRPSRSD